MTKKQEMMRTRDALDTYSAADFARQYTAIAPRSAAEYNRKRPAGTPRWNTVAAHCGLRKWSELLRHCGLKRPQRTQRLGRQRPAVVFRVQREIDALRALESLDTED